MEAQNQLRACELKQIFETIVNTDIDVKTDIKKKDLLPLILTYAEH